MGKELVLVGAGHAHMVTLANLHRFIEKGHKVTVIGPSSYHYYSGMGPGMLGKVYTPSEIRFAVQHVVEKQNGIFILDKVSRVDPDKKILYLESGRSLAYDVVSFNTGSYVPQKSVPVKGEDVYPVKPIENLIYAQKRLLELFAQEEITVGIVGGGPAALEIAGNTWRLARNYAKNMPRIWLFVGKKFASRFPPTIRKKAATSLTKRGIEILERGYVQEIKNGKIILESGGLHKTNFVFLAIGVKPSPIFEESGLPIGPDGGLPVNEYLQSTEYPEIFGGGDCIYFKARPLDKVGVYAVRQNPVLCHNLLASLEGTVLQAFRPQVDYLLILNMGDGTGIFFKKCLKFSGRLAFMIKDHIDRKFMKKFQSIE